MSSGDLKMALVHDELTRRGGAEIVLENLVQLYPRADTFALYAGLPEMVVDGRRYLVKTSFLQRWPLWFRRRPSRLLPLLPQAAEQFDLSFYDVVISSASGFAKSIITRVNVPHICYCHTPTRYLWSATHSVVARQPRWVRWPGRALLHYLRLADFAASQRVDLFIANSRFTQERIANYYRRPSTVVYPPIDTAFYTPEPHGIRDKASEQGYFLVVGRLTPTKGFDQAIRVCDKLRLPLVVVGTGSDFVRLRKLAGKQTRFTGKISRLKLRRYYREAYAILQPGEEDFGMATAEALSCGTPVIAYSRGGAAEVVEHRVTGLLYDEPREEALAEALRQFLAEPHLFSRERLQRSVLRFTRQRFREEIERLVEKVLAENDPA